MATSTYKNKNTATLFVGIVCLVLAIWSVLWFWASILTVRPEKIVTQWEQGKLIFDEQLASELIAPLKQSLAINSLDANTQMILARIYERLANNSDKKQLDYNALAEQQYNKAILNQPTWDYAWARLANFYNRQQTTNTINREELVVGALTKAIDLGPYETNTQKMTIPLIFEHWKLLASSKNGAQMEKVIQHALKYHTNALLTLDSAKQHEKLDVLEPLLSQQWHINRLKKYRNEIATSTSEHTRLDD
jgi:hypothetical protein